MHNAAVVCFNVLWQLGSPFAYSQRTHPFSISTLSLKTSSHNNNHKCLRVPFIRWDLAFIVYCLFCHAAGGFLLESRQQRGDFIFALFPPRARHGLTIGVSRPAGTP